MESIPFTKMHGLGNDFVVVDARRQAFAPNPRQARAIADRRTGVGCDQLIVLEQARNSLADVFMRIRNADGGEVEACGNAARCVAELVMRETGNRQAIIETAAGLLDAEASDDGMVAVDMGPVRFDWRDIPLSSPADTLHLDLNEAGLGEAVAVNVGNPHAVFFVSDAEAVRLGEIGPRIERHAMFPEYTNVETAQVLGEDRIRLRVWERGVGITRACGTGACAAAAAAHRRRLTGRRVEVILDGGPLRIDLLRDGHVLMTGPTATSFVGTMDAATLT